MKSEVVLSGMDVHDKKIVTQTGMGFEKPRLRKWGNTPARRRAMIQYFKEMGPKRIVCAYEASSVGFGLHDELRDAGIECYVLAPTKMKKSSKDKKDKTDAKDALRILQTLRNHIFARNDLPAVWVPDPQTRDDRELVRARIDLGKKIGTVKAQIRSLLKRYPLEKPEEVGKAWTLSHLSWLGDLSLGHCEGLGSGARRALLTLLRQLRSLEVEVSRLDKDMEALAETEKYSSMSQALMSLPGIGLVTAMVFLTELGDPKRFKNRRQIASYFGLAPATFESGEKDERKGHIMRDGSPRVRKVLNQATWARIRANTRAQEMYESLVYRNPKKKKIAVVAMMRRLSIELWQVAKKSQSSAISS